MATTGQTINDRLNAVRYALAGQGLARTVCKATTEEVLGPKRKHIDYLLTCTEEPNVSIPQLANLLIDRTQNTSWTVVFKSLITIHHLLNAGNERFTQYLATSNHSFELNDFMDRTTPQGYGMSTFVRRYAKYINDKIVSYKTLAIDLCKIKPGKDNALRTMNMENLSKTLPVVHAQFDALLEFGVEQKDLNNGIILAAFKLLYKDLNRIFAAYQEAIINLIERYFKLSRKKTREALAMYKKYLDRMDKVAQFFKIVESVGLDKNEMPDTSKLSSLLAVLEEHYAQLEAKKRGTTPTSPDGGGPDAEADDPEESVSPQGEKDAPSCSQAELEAATKSAQEQPPQMPAATDQPRKAAAAPARPSPKVSPKVSPSEQKPASASASKEPAPPPVAEKKAAPPERPAKPPSRPPPPTATPTKTAPTKPNPTAGGLTEVKPQARQLTASASPTPPSRPPPAVHPPAQLRGPSPSASTSLAAETTETHQVPSSSSGDSAPVALAAQQAEGNQPSVQDEQQVDNINHEDDADSGHNGNEPDGDDGPPSSRDGSSHQPTCSTTLSETTSGQEAGRSEAQEGTQQAEYAAETNHVLINNGVQSEDEGEPVAPPPPPPPIDDEGVDPGQLEDDEEQAENGNGNYHNAAAAPVDRGNMPAPPPPPPVEDDTASS